MLFDAFFSKRKSAHRASKPSSSKKHRAWLEIQPLEDRCTPAVLGQAIVTQAYQDLLLRPVDASGLSTWGNFIDAGNPAAVAALGIQTATSQEWNHVQINELYSTYLGRAPGAEDAANWDTFLSSGGTYHQMVILISSSDEAFQNAGSTNSAWLSDLFTNALGRTIDSGTQSQLTSLLNAGFNRAQVDAVVLNTPEYYGRLVQQSYQTFLGRPADDASLVFQVNALQAGFTYQDLLAGLVGSSEYANDSANGTSTTVVASTSTAVVTQSVILTAIVTPTTTSGTPTGLVTFLSDGVAIGTAAVGANGQATLATTGLSLGTNTITATYGGDTLFGTSSGTSTVTVNKADTTTSLTSSVNPTVFGQSVTFTAVVSINSPGSGFASGTVTFTDTSGASPVTLGTGTINATTGVATFSSSTLTLGSHTITATYVPGAQNTFNASTSAAVTQVVNKTATTVAVSSSATPSVFGQQVTFTAIVTATAPGTGTPTGSVTFVDTTTGTTLGTANLSSGTATLAVSSLGVGSHNIQANYAGDTNFNTGTGSTTQIVNKASTTTAVATSTSSPVFGQSFTVTATVAATSPGTGIPTGTVTFTDENNNVLGTATLDGTGKGSISVPNLAAGGHTISVNYAGDANYQTSGGTTAVTVAKASTTTSNASSINPSVFGQSVNFTATIVAVSPGTGIPTGTGTFGDTTTGATLGTSNVDGTGKAVLAVSNLAVGTHVVAATYNGSGNYNTSTGSFTQTVNKDATALALTSSLNPAAAGVPVTFTATVAASAPGAGTPTGTVTFVDTTTGTTLGNVTLDGTGKATVTTSALAAGTHVIVATYNGDLSYLTSNNNLTQTIT
ncbi:hypothetical protein BH10PLA2_BH10PLA2_04690 [soil metagenome]